MARRAAIAVGAALVLAFPAGADPYMLTVGIGILNHAVLATAWNFVGGFIGYISLGHGALAGLGAYATALLVTAAGLPSFVALLAAAAIVGVLAVPIGAAALRVRGASFVIVSIALVLFNCITGLLRPDAGRVTYGGHDITGKAPHRIARAGIGRSFQLCRVFPRMTVLDNLLVAVCARGRDAQLAGGRDRKSVERARGWLAAWGSITSRPSRPATCRGASRSCSSSPGS
jgi:hypothetical protein